MLCREGGREGGRERGREEFRGWTSTTTATTTTTRRGPRPRYAIQVAVETSEDRRNRNETGWPPTLPSHNAFVLCRVLGYRSYSAGAPVKTLCPWEAHYPFDISYLFWMIRICSKMKIPRVFFRTISSRYIWKEMICGRSLKENLNDEEMKFRKSDRFRRWFNGNG